MGVDITGDRGVVVSADMLFDALVNEERGLMYVVYSLTMQRLPCPRRTC